MVIRFPLLVGEGFRGGSTFAKALPKLLRPRYGNAGI